MGWGLCARSGANGLKGGVFFMELDVTQAWMARVFDMHTERPGVSVRTECTMVHHILGAQVVAICTMTLTHSTLYMAWGPAHHCCAAQIRRISTIC